jgi:subtilisin family serine protease
LLFVLSSAEAFASEEAPAVQGQLLVRFKDGVSKVAIEDAFQLMGNSGAKQVTPADPQLYLVNLPQGMDNATGLSLYNGLAAVALAEENFIYYAVAEPDDPFYYLLWGLPKISAPAAWDITTGDPSVVVLADTDTGAQYDHVDLAGNIWLNTGEICDNGIDDDGNGYVDDCVGWNFPVGTPYPIDTNGHGTNTAGIMGAVGNNGIGVTGVNWNAQLMILRMGNGTPEDPFRESNIIPAIDYAWYMGTLPPQLHAVINASWGGRGRSAMIEAAIQRANDADVLFVTAAGNDGTNNDVIPTYPCNYNIPNIICVANTTQSDVLYPGGVVGPSNWGPNTVHLGAPGTNIYSTFPGNRYVAYYGTSQASPHVAGTAALVWSANPDLAMADVKDAILSSVDLVDALVDKVITGGRLNADGAVKSALGK